MRAAQLIALGFIAATLFALGLQLADIHADLQRMNRTFECEVYGACQ